MVHLAAMTVMRAIRRNKASPGDHRVAMAGLGNISLESCEDQLAQWFDKSNVIVPPGASQSGLDVSKKAVLAGLDTLFRFSAPKNRPIDGFLVLFCGSGDVNGDWVMAQNHTVSLSDVLQVWDATREEHSSERPQFLYIVSDADHSGQWSELAYEHSYVNVMIQASCGMNDMAQPLGVFLSSWLKVQTGELWLDQANSALEAFGTSAKPYVAPGCRTPLLDASGNPDVLKLQRIITLGTCPSHEKMEQVTQKHIEHLQMIQRQAASKGNQEEASIVKPWVPPSEKSLETDDQGPKLEWLDQTMRLLKLQLWDPAVVVEALRSLWSLAYHEKMRQAFDETWISVVLAAMENHLPDLDLLISASGALSRLAWNTHLVKSMRERDRCARVLRHILQLHRSDILLCRMCFVLMYSIAENDTTSNHSGSGLRDLCLVPLLNALEIHLYCPVTTSAAMSALAAMHPTKPDLHKGPEEIGQAESFVRSIDAFAAVMNAHPDNTDVHRQASLALSRITASPEGCRLLAEATSGSEAIGHLIGALCASVSRFEVFGYEVAWQCCLCLRGMTQNAHLKWAIVSHENSKSIRSCVFRFAQAVQTPDWLVGVSKALLDVFDEFSIRRGIE
eukprot:gnl/MRDRNA2_/MRDRNA2_121340_c0_seq1.p1 gnl/MRDRNA2_/MRDRNA2_121340_c0~~gnl/MRDRNA2_/MRDRNA2_121340_c0_seq1.p1  ORF type:complete len:618 (-),score=102.11 gnl/MRDRNA2_/MRDRNA2_121340_c0_seq1:78-1931(-)